MSVSLLSATGRPNVSTASCRPPSCLPPADALVQCTESDASISPHSELKLQPANEKTAPKCRFSETSAGRLTATPVQIRSDPHAQRVELDEAPCILLVICSGIVLESRD